ncbi:hypothetical protein LGQ02_18430 [Bacillus shivajii]|uniref:hypothetical protein n=1 Tax=Bacillus shivajii TaxID=1983719 RepID=UPI001CFA8066|nr:hypothetical protein [Bacillus shivajii]UCZ52737.1 hypothetical protein LGQ02_18430 [Bacillus shivajii]
MKVRIGVVGPSDSVNRIIEVASSFSEYEMLEIIPFSYEKTEEAEQIVRENRNRVDQWLFSGQAPYYYVESKGLLEDLEVSFPPLYGSSLLGTLLELIMEKGRDVTNISLDTIKESEVAFINKAHSLDDFTFYTYSYGGYREADEIIAFHEKLYDEGKTQVALTCIKEVHKRLTERNIPCYRIIPSQLAFKLVLRYIKERGESTLYRKSQIAVLGIEVNHSSTTEEGQYYSYEIKRQSLDLKHMLLDQAENLQGSFVQIGDGLFFIYTTRGEVDMHFDDKSIFYKLSEMKMKSELKFRVGIGYGITALGAEQNLRLALQYARDEDEAILISVNEEKEVHQYTEQDVNSAISFQPRNWGADWEDKFKDAHISPSVVSKLQSFSFHYKTNAVTVKEVASWLKGTERNARRILSEMERLGLAKVRGMEQPGNAGRPRKVYELLF